MSLLEDRILRIVELRRKGLNERAIAENLNVSSEDVKFYESSLMDCLQRANSGRGVSAICREMRISQLVLTAFANYRGVEISEHSELNPERKERYEQIKTFAEQGFTAREISERTGVALPVVYYASNKYGIELKRAGDKMREEIKKLAEKGLTKKEIAKEIDVSYSHTKGICRQLIKAGEINSVKDERKIARFERRPEIDSMAEKGLLLKEIGDRVGLTGERIRQYLHKAGLHEKRKEARRNIAIQESERKEVLENLLCGVLSRAYNTEEDWVTRKAFEYVLQRKVEKFDSYSFETLVEFFRKYEKAKNSGKKVSLGNLVKGTGIPYLMGASIVLKAVGLKTLCQPTYRERESTPKEKKEALRRIVKIGSDLSSVDIAYFLRIPGRVASQNLKRYGREPRRGLRNMYFDVRGNRKKTNSGRKDLTYRLASQVYEAVDLGYGIEESAFLLDTSDRVVQTALAHRGEFSNKISKTLKILYPGRTSRKPYKDFRD